LTFGKQETRSLLCSRLASVAEIRAVASAFEIRAVASELFASLSQLGFFYSGPYFLIYRRFLKSLGV